MILLRHVGMFTIAASGLVLSGPYRALQPTVHRDAGCQVRGVWELVSVSQNGKDQPLAGYRGMKVLTDRHFMFVGQAAKRDTLPLKTETDTLRAYQMSGGAGSHTTSRTTHRQDKQNLFYRRSSRRTLQARSPHAKGPRDLHFSDPHPT